MPVTTVSGTSISYQLGQTQLNYGQFNGPYESNFSNSYLINPSFPKKRTQIGFGYYDSRVDSRPYDYTPYSPAITGGSSVLVEFGTISGTVLGKIRSDIQNSIFLSCDFTLQSQGGCMDFNLKLTEYPPFPINYGSIITININNSTIPWFTGEVSYADDPSVGKDSYEFRGNGFSRYFDNQKGEGSYYAGDVGSIVYDILASNVIGNGPVKYNPTKLTLVTGVTTTNTIQIGKYSLKKIFDTFAQMAGAIWGVDGAGDFYFLQVSQTLQRVFFVGYDLQIFDPKTNLDTVRNLITVQRKTALGSGGSGWVVAGVYNDTSSAKKYGNRELNYQGPGYWGQEESDIVGNALLNDLKNPSTGATLSKIKINGDDYYLPYGAIRVVNAPMQYDAVVCDIDNVSEWTKTGSGDSIGSDATDYFTWADGSVKFIFTNSVNDVWQTDCSFKGNIKRVRFYIRSTISGMFLRFGFGEFSWNEHVSTVDILQTSNFMVFDWDVSDLDVTSIGKFGFMILNNMSAETTIWVDRFEVRAYGHQHHNYNITKSKYSIQKEGQLLTLEAGKIPPKMENYLEGLFAQSNELKYTGAVT